MVERAKKLYARNHTVEPNEWLVQEIEGHVILVLANAKREMLACYEWHPKSNRLTRKSAHRAAL